VFGNWVNFNDIFFLLQRSRSAFSSLSSKIIQTKTSRIKSAWEHTSGPPINWWDIPAVRERWNRLISGDPNIEYYEYISEKYLNNKGTLSALSVGCGTGHRELKWAAGGKFSVIDAYDLSEQRIRFAAEAAEKEGFGDIIHYHVGDIYTADISRNHYDIILLEQSLHHFSPVEALLVRLNTLLKQDGLVVVNEFVGPTRFQWTDRQLEAINGLLSTLPVKYRTLWNSDSVKRRISRPSKLSMILGDPSEAVESSNIMPMLHKVFNVLEVNAYGGTILHILFHGIAHNFLSEDDETQRLLNVCFQLEDSLLKNGDVESDFVVAVCAKR